MNMRSDPSFITRTAAESTASHELRVDSRISCEAIASRQERKERTLLGSVARQRLVKTQKTYRVFNKYNYESEPRV
jgi:hypothetical protein